MLIDSKENLVLDTTEYSVLINVITKLTENINHHILDNSEKEIVDALWRLKPENMKRRIKSSKELGGPITISKDNYIILKKVLGKINGEAYEKNYKLELSEIEKMNDLYFNIP